MNRISPATQRLVFAMKMIGDYCRPHPVCKPRYRAEAVLRLTNNARDTLQADYGPWRENGWMMARLIKLLERADAMAVDAIARIDMEAQA